MLRHTGRWFSSSHFWNGALFFPQTKGYTDPKYVRRLTEVVLLRLMRGGWGWRSDSLASLWFATPVTKRELLESQINSGKELEYAHSVFI